MEMELEDEPCPCWISFLQKKLKDSAFEDGEYVCVSALQTSFRIYISELQICAKCSHWVKRRCIDEGVEIEDE
jgi:hypothetical protein